MITGIHVSRGLADNSHHVAGPTIEETPMASDTCTQSKKQMLGRMAER